MSLRRRWTYPQLTSDAMLLTAPFTWRVMVSNALERLWYSDCIPDVRVDVVSSRALLVLPYSLNATVKKC